MVSRSSLRLITDHSALLRRDAAAVVERIMREIKRRPTSASREHIRRVNFRAAAAPFATVLLAVVEVRRFIWLRLRRLLFGLWHAWLWLGCVRLGVLPLRHRTPGSQALLA